jgi:hypothetical protein
MIHATTVSDWLCGMNLKTLNLSFKALTLIYIHNILAAILPAQAGSKENFSLF